MAEAFSHTVCFFLRFLTLVSCFFTKLYFALFCIGCVYYMYIWFIRVEVFFFCPFILLLLSLFFLFRIPVDNVKRTNCVRTRSPFRCLTFDYAIYMFSSFVLQSIGNGIIIPFSMALAILMCVFFSLLFYASLKRDILVLPGYSVSFDQIIYFQCKTQRLWRLQNFSIQLIVQRESSGNWLNEEWFYKWNVFFVRCRHKTHYFFN